MEHTNWLAFSIFRAFMDTIITMDSLIGFYDEWYFSRMGFDDGQLGFLLQWVIW